MYHFPYRPELFALPLYHRRKHDFRPSAGSGGIPAPVNIRIIYNMSTVIEVEDEPKRDKSADSTNDDAADPIVDESTHYFDDKPLDYIDDVTCFTPSKTQAISATDSANSTPRRPPRHVKLKKQHSRQGSGLDGVIVNGDMHRDSITSGEKIHRSRYVTIGVQTTATPPYRLRLLPRWPSSASVDETSATSTRRGGTLLCCACVGRVLLSQCGLSVALFAWAMIGATAFHYTEGPYEKHQSSQLTSQQNGLVIELASELRQVIKEDAIWHRTIWKYVRKHETLLLEAVSSGYGEGGVAGHIWTFPGCVLFSISLLTTLGYGAPVPRTPLGRGAAVVFAAVGIPLHLLLVLNIGMLIALRLKRCATNFHYKASSVTQENKCPAFRIPSAAKWLNWFPVAAIVGYYLFGIIAFGVARHRNLESLLFPLDFTVTGGVARTKGYVRIFYGLYLEGAVLLAGTTVALLQDSAANRLTDFGLKLGILTNSQ